MIDSHSHIYCDAFDDDRDEVVARAREAGVRHIILPNENLESISRVAALHEQYPDYCSMALGLHPEDVHDDYLDVLERMRPSLDRYPVVAVGEIGIDLYWDKTFLEQQREVLKTQMRWAKELDLPVCLHVRKAYNELFGLLRDLNFGSYRGVMHCFGGSVQEANKAIEMGFHVGIGGVVTFKNATLAAVAAAVPLERILLETDAPYLAPVPYRGKRNESAYIPIIAAKIAEVRGISTDEVAAVTTAAAQSLFRL